MNREQAVQAAAEPILRHLRAWGGTWTAQGVAEELRRSWAGGSGRESSWQFAGDAIYVAPGRHAARKGGPEAVRVSYQEAIEACEGMVQRTLW